MHAYLLLQWIRVDINFLMEAQNVAGSYVVEAKDEPKDSALCTLDLVSLKQKISSLTYLPSCRVSAATLTRPARGED